MTQRFKRKHLWDLILNTPAGPRALNVRFFYSLHYVLYVVYELEHGGNRSSEGGSSTSGAGLDPPPRTPASRERIPRTARRPLYGEARQLSTAG